MASDEVLKVSLCGVEQEEGESCLGYFAIGSMMNPVSVAHRGLKPISSQPAELLDYRLVFFSSLGFGEAVPEEGSSFHGVLHYISEEDMITLDRIEMGYLRVPATAKLYDGSKRRVFVYTRDSEKRELEDKSNECFQPHERYLEIMIAGAEYYGVNPEHIGYLRSIKCVPRPTPDEYLSLGAPETDLTMTLDQVLENDGFGDKPLYFTMNSKVVEATFDRSSKDFIRLRSFVQEMGPVGEIITAKMMYDPKYGIPSSLEEVTPEHAAYCEHNFCAAYKLDGSLDHFKVVAHLMWPSC